MAEDVPADELSYSFDWDNDGVYEIVDQLSNQATQGFEKPGKYVVRVRVRDDGGGEAVSTAEISVELYPLFMPLVRR